MKTLVKNLLKLFKSICLARFGSQVLAPHSNDDILRRASVHAHGDSFIERQISNL